MKKTVLNVLAVSCVLGSLSLLAGGCAKPKVESDKAMVTSPPVAQAPARPDTGAGMGKEESLADKGFKGGAGAFLEGRTTGPMLPVYFDFDRSDIRDDQKGRITGNADFLKSNRNLRVRVEGNCDERGTNEYNMALGERRAQNAKKYLVNLGVEDTRLDTISYGEEQPLMTGGDEETWEKNRRADFVALN